MDGLGATLSSRRRPEARCENRSFVNEVIAAARTACSMPREGARRGAPFIATATAAESYSKRAA